MRNQALHPLFQAILATMAPAPTTPACPPPYSEYVLDSDVGELAVWLADEEPVRVWLGPTELTRQLQPWTLRNLTEKADAMQAQERAERNDDLRIERAT